MGRARARALHDERAFGERRAGDLEAVAAVLHAHLVRARLGGCEANALVRGAAASELDHARSVVGRTARDVEASAAVPRANEEVIVAGRLEREALRVGGRARALLDRCAVTRACA